MEQIPAYLAVRWSETVKQRWMESEQIFSVDEVTALSWRTYRLQLGALRARRDWLRMCHYKPVSIIMRYYRVVEK